MRFEVERVLKHAVYPLKDRKNKHKTGDDEVCWLGCMV